MRAALANAMWLAASLRAHRRFERALCDPATAQWHVLRENLARNAGTVYGRAHGFNEILSYDDFTRRIPIVGYDDLAPWIARVRRGEQAVLTDEPVTHLVPTSGSTGARKLIPFTASLQNEFNAAIGPWLVDLMKAHPSVALGPAYWSITPLARNDGDETSRIPIGFTDDSNYLGSARSRFISALMAVPPAVRHITDLDNFRYFTLRSLLRARSLRFISVWHPSFLTLLLNVLPEFWDELLGDLSDGNCRRLARLPPTVASTLKFPPLPSLARQLRRATPTQPTTVWPKLCVVSCWADVHAADTAGELRTRLPQVFVQPKGLLSTEAFITLPFAGEHPLAISSHFFEFADERGAVIPAGELRVGAAYEVIVTTGGGLYRYRTGDRVEVTGWLGHTPALRFLGRGARVSDVCGEKLSECFVAEVVRAACSGFTKPPSFAMLAPEEGADGAPWHYEFFLAGEGDADLAAHLDRALRANPHYALCRDLSQLGPVQVTRVGEDANEIYLATEMTRGLRLGDIKPAVLSPHANWTRRFSRNIVKTDTRADTGRLDLARNG